MIQKWITKTKESLGSFLIFRLFKETVISPKDSKEHKVIVLDTYNWVNIVPLTEENEVIMVRQFRHGTKEITLEIPGGACDLTDENPIHSATRELEEETGFVSNEVSELGWVYPNPAFQTNKCFTYLAKNCKLEKKQNLDIGEDIEVIKIPLSDIPELIQNKTITHSLVIAAFHFLNLKF